MNTSHSGRPTLDSLTTRFRDSLGFTNPHSKDNKPDFRELDLGSPVSTLNNTTTTATSSSSSSSGSVSGKNSSTHLPRKPDNSVNSRSDELYEIRSPAPSGSVPATSNNKRPGHRRSVSAGCPLIYSGSSFTTAHVNGATASSSVSSNPTASGVLPSGNICPSGKILKTMAARVPNKAEKLGTGSGNYGHGSIIRSGISGGGGAAKVGSSDPEEVKRNGNEMYKRGNFVEALALYDKAISMSPDNAAYRGNRAAALTALGRLGESVKECEEAVGLDSGYGRAHQRLASLYLRLGHPDNARYHLCFPGQQADQPELHKLQLLEKHISKCADARKIGDWKSALREMDAAIAIGADSSPQLFACKTEALLKLNQIEVADSFFSNAPKFEHLSSQMRSFGMISEAYVLYVRAQVEMALGRYENAVSVAEKAALIDCNNIEVVTLLNNVKMVAKARSRGNDFFNAGRYEEACSAYGEGLRYDSFSYVLYCNRAVCWSKLGLWERSVEDCSQALKIQPNYTKALLRRAASNRKLGMWAEAVRDYETLRKELPGDKEVAESLRNAQVALMKSYGEQVQLVKFSGEVEEISSLDRFKVAIASPGISVVHFKVASNEQCEEISPFVNMLCIRYPSIHFLKVDVEENVAVAKAESITRVPTFKIYKNGVKMKGMISPSHQSLEESVRTCIL